MRATRDARARELLTELMPRLLRALADQAEPDAAFARFDEFVSSLPAGVQLFSLFRANPRLLALVADLMGTAPRLAGHLSRHTSLFEAMLAPDFFEPIPAAAALRGRARPDARARPRPAGRARRRPAAGRRPGSSRSASRCCSGWSTAQPTGPSLTAIAEIVIARAAAAWRAWLGEPAWPRRRAARFVVLGLGKLGSRELTIGSDLDLIFIFDADEEARVRRRAAAAGARPATRRLGQRLIRALTAPTAEGPLYEIDTRLRPVGQCRAGRLLAGQLRALPAERRRRPGSIRR